jgi:stalled ribosome rescue protein Dom34
MSAFVVWLDREHARVFEFSSSKMERRNLTARHAEHHTHELDQLDRQTWEKAYFTDLTALLTGASRLLLVGPGLAKHHFQNYLSEHFPLLSKRVVGCEVVDHPTDGEIAAMARKVFKL